MEQWQKLLHCIIENCITIINNCLIIDTLCYNGPGCGVCAKQSNVTFTGQCKLRNNKITNLSGNGNGVGGGMYLANSHLYLNGSIIIVVKNVAMKNGGGMCILRSSISTTNHSSLVIAENIAQSGDGGGLYIRDARANIAGSMVLTSNIATDYGGGISVYKSTWSNIGHVLLYNNTSQ